jgi:hypothetical protein
MSMALFRVLMTRFEERDVSTSMASAYLEQSSMTLKVLNLIPPTMLSLMKSIAPTLIHGCLLLQGLFYSGG